MWIWTIRLRGSIRVWQLWGCPRKHSGLILAVTATGTPSIWFRNVKCNPSKTNQPVLLSFAFVSEKRSWGNLRINKQSFCKLISKISTIGRHKRLTHHLNMRYFFYENVSKISKIKYICHLKKIIYIWISLNMSFMKYYLLFD